MRDITRTNRCTPETIRIFKLAFTSDPITLHYEKWTEAHGGRYQFNICRKQLAKEVEKARASLVAQDGGYSQDALRELEASLRAAENCVVRLKPHRKPSDNGPTRLVVEAAYVTNSATAKAMREALEAYERDHPPVPPPQQERGGFERMLADVGLVNRPHRLPPED